MAASRRRIVTGYGGSPTERSVFGAAADLTGSASTLVVVTATEAGADGTCLKEAAREGGAPDVAVLRRTPCAVPVASERW
jgi:hypothetical protein